MNSPVLRTGTSGAEVGNWQRFLVIQGCRDADQKSLVVDEIYGERTASATCQFQQGQGLLPTGIVDPLTRKRAQDQGFIPFLQAKNCNINWPRYRTVDLIVIHTMECLERPDAAENVAAWFAGQTSYPAPQASAHYCVDENSIVQCVRDSDIAWHANEVNDHAIGIEHAGFARQTADEWQDEKSRAILWQSAQLTARIAKRHMIPVQHVTPEGVRKGARGFTGHVDVNQAYGRTHGHFDPGPNFPWTSYLALVKVAM